MNNNVLSVVGFAALLGIARSGSFSKDEIENKLKQYFAIPENKKIPNTYLKHELSRLTVLPDNLRTSDQKEVISMIQSYMSQ